MLGVDSRPCRPADHRSGPRDRQLPESPAVNVTRAALPQLRAHRSGLVMTISSTAGVSVAGDFQIAYVASKFGLEGFMEGLAPEVAPFGIKTMLVEPGFFRTELLTPQSTQYAEPSIDDYVERTKQTIEAWQGMDGKQGGDPAKLAGALVKLAALEEPPVAFAAGADAVATSKRRPTNSSSRPAPTVSCLSASATRPDPTRASPQRKRIWSSGVQSVSPASGGRCRPSSGQDRFRTHQVRVSRGLLVSARIRFVRIPSWAALAARPSRDAAGTPVCEYRPPFVGLGWTVLAGGWVSERQ